MTPREITDQAQRDGAALERARILGVVATPADAEELAVALRAYHDGSERGELRRLLVRLWGPSPAVGPEPGCVGPSRPRGTGERSGSPVPRSGVRLPRPGIAVSRLASGILRWRSTITGATGTGFPASHAEADAENALARGVGYWIKGCSCDDCDRARGANDDEQ